jgi:hypothetical protein
MLRRLLGLFRRKPANTRRRNSNHAQVAANSPRRQVNRTSRNAMVVPNSPRRQVNRTSRNAMVVPNSPRRHAMVAPPNIPVAMTFVRVKSGGFIEQVGIPNSAYNNFKRRYRYNSKNNAYVLKNM